MDVHMIFVTCAKEADTHTAFYRAALSIFSNFFISHKQMTLEIQFFVYVCVCHI